MNILISDHRKSSRFSGAEERGITQRIGIVGGSGYIGSSLAEYLSQKFQIVVIDVKPPKKSNLGFAFYCCNVQSYKSVKKALKETDLVIHAAIVQIPLINEQKKLAYEVNIVGTQNVCRAVEENTNIKGMILAGSWHTMGERGIAGVIDEEFGFRPDKVEERARLYALSKIAQESILRLYDEMSEKIYGIIRMGTVLGQEMPGGTAANTFIEQGIRGDPITPFKHSMYRPMLYVDIEDICRAYEVYMLKILKGGCEKGQNSLSHTINVFYQRPITILRLAEIVKSAMNGYSQGRVTPSIEIIDKGLPTLFTSKDAEKIKVDISRAREYLGIKKLISPSESIRRIVRAKFRRMQSQE